MREVRLQTVVSIAQLVSTLAVVASLAYVATEFGRSRTLSSTDVQHVLYGRMLESDRLLASDQDLVEVLIRAEDPTDSLTHVDLRRFLAYENIFYDTWEMALDAWNNGVLDEEYWTFWNDWFSGESRRRPRPGWTGNRHNHGPDFVQHVEGILSGADEAARKAG